MRYALVKPDGTIAKTFDFVGTPPMLAQNKGRWIPDTPPAFDSMTQQIKVSLPIAANATAVPYIVQPLPAADIAKLAALKDAEDTRTLMRALPFTKALAKMTPADLDSYIDANLTNIVDMRSFIKKLSQIVLALVKREMF